MTKIISMKQAAQLKGNSIVAQEEQWLDTSCEFKGLNNALLLEQSAKCNKASIIFFGSNSRIHVGTSSRLSGKVSLGHDCSIVLGSHNTITANLELSAAEGTSITIGSDCMFGIGCRVITHDFHPLFDALTNERLNVSKSIVIEDHVWVGDGAVIRKGVRVGSGSVIGERAVVLHDVPPNSVVVGAPAKVVKTNIRWERDSLRSTETPALRPGAAQQIADTVRGLIRTFEFGGQQFRFFIENEHDEISKYLIRGQFYEQEELRLISPYLSADDVVADIGANVGNHSIYFSKVLGCQKIITFEMNAAAQRIADINYLLNGTRNITCNSGFALGDGAGTGSLTYESHNLGGAKFVRDDAGDIPVFAGDQVIGDHRPTFLKIDVEGDEPQVLTGFSQTISKYRPKIFVEVDEANEAWMVSWIESNNYCIVEEYKRYRANRNLMLLPN
ncbi:FkbM family methyltransferase [Microvirga pakistanensis]|uniref:FkbM family methyltransferase n=1 Tax=Microvirga pakistanensis TaxID=1682650 RepID=UPI00106B4147|nr:FkbM family methyltransferase [Microvirga pakistanensis]